MTSIQKMTAAGITAGAMLLGSIGAASANGGAHVGVHAQTLGTNTHVQANAHSYNALAYRVPSFTFLKGENEVPGPGDPDAVGYAKVQLKPNKNEVCVNMRVFNLDPKAAAAHIHNAPTGESGPVVVTLPTPNERGIARGCVEVSEELVMNLAEKPADYYINVHNEAYPAGAVRGQL